MVDLFSGGLTETSILILRLLMTPLLVYNMTWSIAGFKSLIKGVSFPASIYQSVVFLMSFGLLGFNLMAFLGNEASAWSLPFSLIFLCAFFLASILAFFGNKYAVAEGFERFYWLFKEGHMGLALRIADLNRLDPDYAEETLALAEAGLALHLAKKLVGD